MTLRQGARRKQVQAMRRHITRWLLALVLLGITNAARAEMVEVAPGVTVTKKTFSSWIDEQPFYGFSEKTPEQQKTDADFLAASDEMGSREAVSAAAIERGWAHIDRGDLSEAAKQFNQAWLLAPERSEIYQGFAVITAARFGDLEYAEELFKIALRQPKPRRTLKADYGRLLLKAKRRRQKQSWRKACATRRNSPMDGSALDLRGCRRTTPRAHVRPQAKPTNSSFRAGR